MTEKVEKEGLSPMDPSSYSRPDQFIVTSVHLQWDVNFDESILDGHVEVTAERVKASCEELILDLQDLVVSSVVDKDSLHPLLYKISSNVKAYGSKMAIELPRNMGKKVKVMIQYRTSPGASGLQWLPPEQTGGKKHPYMFSQCQAVHARSLLPCQDTPAVKAPYSAKVSVPKDLTALMSAIAVGEPVASGEQRCIFSFEQKVAVPIYLLALAVGHLERRSLGPRTGVWSEPQFVDAAAKEFDAAERLLSAAEDVCGPYVWGVYDMLVLPPSFPFGGMENPCMTFLTPTLLAGDKSLVNVVAHEIAHSWTGNLVTNKNWEHFWLNEGFTVFVERRIIQRLQGDQEQDFAAVGGLSELNEAINTLGHENPLTSLVLDLRDVHPDDSFSKVPYEKGSCFLRYLETIVGGPKQFEPFLRHYLDKFKYMSVGTDQFKAELIEHFGPQLTAVDWNYWLNKPGMPPVIPEYDQSLAKACRALMDKWISWSEESSSSFTKEDYESLSVNQKIQFLQEMLNESSHKWTIPGLEAMGRLYGLNETRNAELRFRWLRLGLKTRWPRQVDCALAMVGEVGRLKYVRPLYSALYEWEEVRPKAVAFFKEHRKYMMYVTAYAVAQDLHLND